MVKIGIIDMSHDNTNMNPPQENEGLLVQNQECSGSYLRLCTSSELPVYSYQAEPQPSEWNLSFIV